MHLDCVFSVVSDSVCIMLDEMLVRQTVSRMSLRQEFTAAKMCSVLLIVVR